LLFFKTMNHGQNVDADGVLRRLALIGRKLK
jgi:hypothetical protein